MTKIIDSFTGDYEFLSNFHICKRPLILHYTRFATAEHYYQAMKSADRDHFELIRTAPTPGDAKRLGRAAPLRHDWEYIKDYVMLCGLRCKFSDPALMGRLKATDPHILIEGNTWGDEYWGVCKGNGLNKLGEMLMLIRTYGVT